MIKRTITQSILVVLVITTLSACGSLGQVTTFLPSPTQSPTLVSAPQQPAPVPASVSGASGDLLAAFQGTLENIYTAVSPSVVNIRVVQMVDASNSTALQLPGFPFFNFPQTQQQPQQQYQSALGSGFVWDNNGDIVTNNHVVSGADKIEVTFSDGTILPATIVGTDPDSDLAVIKVNAPSGLLVPVSLSDSNEVKVGQLAIAIGNPFGLEGTMTTGIISAVGRSLPADETSTQSYIIPDVIQTDAPINPGNSGGVLVDSQGQVIGVTSAIESTGGSSAGIGFAIPSTIVNNVVPSLIKDGTYIHTWLGISGITLTPDFASAMNLNTYQRGALIEDVTPSSPAEKAGLRGSNNDATIEGQSIKVGGDVIIAIDNQPVLEMEDLIAYLARNTKVDQVVTITILRDGKEENVDVTLSARPSASERNSNSQSSTRGIRLGIAGLSVDESIANAMNLQADQQGVLIEEVQPGSLADNAGLLAGSRIMTINGQRISIGGDIITAINGQPINTFEELVAALGQLTTDQEIGISILREGKTVQLTLQPGQ